MATVLAWLTGLAKFIPLLERLVAALQGRQLRAQGRAEAQAEQNKADLDAVKKVTSARRAARNAESDAGGVPENDKYVRD